MKKEIIQLFQGLGMFSASLILISKMTDEGERLEEKFIYGHRLVYTFLWGIRLNEALKPPIDEFFKKTLRFLEPTAEELEHVMTACAQTGQSYLLQATAEIIGREVTEAEREECQKRMTNPTPEV